MGKRYRNPNGAGTVYKLSGNRRRPWAAAVTIDWVLDEEGKRLKQNQKIIGYFKTKQEAEYALAEYNNEPYDLDNKNLTFSDVYEMWSEEYFKKIVKSATRTIKSAYNHSEPLHKMRMLDIRPVHMENAIQNAKVGSSTKGRMKSLYNLMYRFCLKNGIVKTDYAVLCESVKREAPAKAIEPFSDEEIELLWNNLSLPYVDMLLIGIYSGWRPQELSILKTADIDIENETMFGGLKTDAGKNRCVPFHSKITKLIKDNYDTANTTLFVDENNEPMTYDKYRNRFNKIKTKLGLKHRPHETRHTFITLMKRANANEYMLKLLVGHYITDITEKVYTHRTIEELRKEINKI